MPTRDPRPTFASQVTRFAVVGAASTVAHLVLYAALRLVLGAQPTNLIALLVTAIGNTAANRHHTFGVRGHDGVWRQHAEGLAVFAVGLGLTSGALAGLRLVAPDAGRAAELSVLVIANLVAALVRFVALRDLRPPTDGTGHGGTAMNDSVGTRAAFGPTTLRCPDAGGTAAGEAALAASVAFRFVGFGG